MSAPVKLMEEDDDQCKNCTFAVSGDHFYTVAFYGWHWFLMRSISLQSRRLLVVDPCGGAHGGRSCRSRSLLSLHRAAPPRADPGEPRSGQIWNRHHELSLSSGSNKHLRRVADFHPQRVNILVALSPFTFRCLFIIIFFKFVDFWKTLQMLLFFFNAFEFVLLESLTHIPLVQQLLIFSPNNKMHLYLEVDVFLKLFFVFFTIF